MFRKQPLDYDVSPISWVFYICNGTGVLAQFVAFTTNVCPCVGCWYLREYEGQTEGNTKVLTDEIRSFISNKEYPYHYIGRAHFPNAHGSHSHTLERTPMFKCCLMSRCVEHITDLVKIFSCHLMHMIQWYLFTKQDITCHKRLLNRFLSISPSIINMLPD